MSAENKRPGANFIQADHAEIRAIGNGGVEREGAAVHIEADAGVRGEATGAILCEAGENLGDLGVAEAARGAAISRAESEGGVRTDADFVWRPRSIVPAVEGLDGVKGEDAAGDRDVAGGGVVTREVDNAILVTVGSGSSGVFCKTGRAAEREGNRALLQVVAAGSECSRSLGRRCLESLDFKIADRLIAGADVERPAFDRDITGGCQRATGDIQGAV